MIYVGYGAVGALLALALVAAGFGLGWELCRLWKRRAREAGDWELLVEENTRLQKELCRRLREDWAEPNSPEDNERARRDAIYEDERQRREAMEQKAVERYFAEMLNYSEDIAYGTDAPLDKLLEEAKR